MTSELRVDNLKGSTTGGSINVLGEGASVTTNLQQGLAKAFNVADMDSDDVFRDSLNFASFTDNGSGDFEFNFTNSMSSAFYAKGGQNGNLSKSTGSVTCNRPAVPTSSSYKFTSVFSNSDSHGSYDADDISVTIHGDLA
jgi:hypothetical protein